MDILPKSAIENASPEQLARLIAGRDRTANILALDLTVKLYNDHSFCGFTITGTAGETLTYGQACYMKSDGKWWLAKADASTTLPCMALATAGIAADAAGIFLPFGWMRDDTWTWTVGGYLHISAATGGLLTTTAPSSSGNYIQKAGVCLSATTIHFAPDITITRLV